MLTGTVLRAQKELRDEILTSFVSSITFVFFYDLSAPIFCRRFEEIFASVSNNIGFELILSGISEILVTFY